MIARLDRRRYAEVYESCIADVDGIHALFDDRGRCPAAKALEAQERMAALKARWKALIREWRDTEVASVVGEALCRIYVKSNSRPSEKWSSDLYDARGSLSFYVK